MVFGFQMIVNSGLAFVRQNNVAGATKQYSAVLIQLSAEVRAILLNKICKMLQFLCHFVNSAHGGQFCAKFCARRISEFWHPKSEPYYLLNFRWCLKVAAKEASFLICGEFPSLDLVEWWHEFSSHRVCGKSVSAVKFLVSVSQLWGLWWFVCIGRWTKWRRWRLEIRWTPTHSMDHRITGTSRRLAF